MSLTDPFRWSVSVDSLSITSAKNGRLDMRGLFSGNSVLSLPSHCGLWRVWLGLDHPSQEVHGELLFRRMSIRFHAEVPSYSSRPTSKTSWNDWSMLWSQKNVRHFHAVLWRQLQHHLRRVAWNGSRSMWVFLTWWLRWISPDKARTVSLFPPKRKETKRYLTTMP